jgi:hypothetical protein
MRICDLRTKKSYEEIISLIYPWFVYLTVLSLLKVSVFLPTLLVSCFDITQLSDNFLSRFMGINSSLLKLTFLSVFQLYHHFSVPQNAIHKKTCVSSFADFFPRIF